MAHTRQSAGLPLPGDYRLRPIGVIRSCYTEKFGIPRQPGLVTAARARLELVPPYDREEAFAGLDGFSHAWLLFIFHHCLDAGWKPMVRPPRLGGKRKVGVFASRAPFRPNPIGLSAVELGSLQREGKQLVLHLRGADLLDGTPVLDIKPYLPYADALPDATAGFAPDPPGRDWHIELSPQAQRQVDDLDPQGERQLALLIEQILRQDPRPGYLERAPSRTAFGMRLYDLEIKWSLDGARVRVESVARLQT